jgi:hypothetical protein
MSNPVSLTLHNLCPWAESYELTTDCITHEYQGVSVNTPKSVRAPDGATGTAWEVVTYAPSVTIPARGKVSGVPLAARHAPTIKAAVAAGALRISEDGNSVAAPKAAAPKKSADKGA